MTYGARKTSVHAKIWHWLTSLRVACCNKPECLHLPITLHSLQHHTAAELNLHWWVVLSYKTHWHNALCSTWWWGVPCEDWYQTLYSYIELVSVIRISTINWLTSPFSPLNLINGVFSLTLWFHLRPSFEVQGPPIILSLSYTMILMNLIKRLSHHFFNMPWW
jgi:hypothetical protein